MWLIGIQIYSNEGTRSFPRGDNEKKIKNTWTELKNHLFLQNELEISTKLGTKHPWVKRVQVCSNEGPPPFPRGNNYENAKIY